MSPTASERRKLQSSTAPIGDAAATASITSTAAAPSRFDASTSGAPSDVHQRFLDRVLGDQRQRELARQRLGDGGLPAPRRARDDDEQRCGHGRSVEDVGSGAWRVLEDGEVAGGVLMVGPAPRTGRTWRAPTTWNWPPRGVHVRSRPSGVSPVSTRSTRARPTLAGTRAHLVEGRSGVDREAHRRDGIRRDGSPAASPRGGAAPCPPRSPRPPTRRSRTRGVEASR